MDTAPIREIANLHMVHMSLRRTTTLTPSIKLNNVEHIVMMDIVDLVTDVILYIKLSKLPN